MLELQRIRLLRDQEHVDLVESGSEMTFRHQRGDPDIAGAGLVRADGGPDDAVQGHRDRAFEEGLRSCENALDDGRQRRSVEIYVVPDIGGFKPNANLTALARQVGDLSTVEGGNGADCHRVVRSVQESRLLFEPLATPGFAVDRNLHVGGVLADQGRCSGVLVPGRHTRVGPREFEYLWRQVGQGCLCVVDRRLVLERRLDDQRHRGEVQGLVA